MPETLTDAERAFMEQRGILEHPRERRLMLLRDFLRDLQFAHQQHFQSGEHQAWLDREDQRATQAFRAAQRTDALSGDVYAGLNQSQTNEHRRLDAQRATERLRERR